MRSGKVSVNPENEKSVVRSVSSGTGVRKDYRCFFIFLLFNSYFNI